MFEVAQLGIMGTLIFPVIVMALILYGLEFVRARLRRGRLRSGNVRETEEAVAEEVALGMSPRSYRSFAHAALGEFSSARVGLLGGARASSILARDYCLCSRILMAAFENDSCRALACAEQLVRLPLEGERHRARRQAVISVARVLAGVVDEEDWEHLGRAAVHEPVLLWACRYAVARVLHSAGRRDQVETLIGAAPPWPESSHFARLHVELSVRGPDSRQAA